MTKKFFFIPVLLITCFFNAQVGINTTDPKSTLHVLEKTDVGYADGIIPPRITGDVLKLKENAYTADQNGAIVYVTDPVSNLTGAIKTQGVLTKGLYIYDAEFINPNNPSGTWKKFDSPDLSLASSTYAIRAKGTLGLLDLSLNLLGSSIYAIPLRTTNLVNSTLKYNVDVTSTLVNDNSYTVPTDGVYQINYSYRSGQGIKTELLGSNLPGIIITKKEVGTVNPVELDSKTFGGIQLLGLQIIPIAVANISLSQAQINHYYTLKSGDVLKFGVIQGGLSLAVLSDTFTEISINKIR